MSDEDINRFMAIWHRYSGGAYAEAIQAIRIMEQQGWKFIPPATDKPKAA
jgi:hypothetical protein